MWGEGWPGRGEIILIFAESLHKIYQALYLIFHLKKTDYFLQNALFLIGQMKHITSLYDN